MPTLFISYRRDDKVAVNKIKDRLKKDFYFEVWIDAESIPGGEDWRKEIRKGIDKCDCVLLMLTPDACASVQVKEEVDYAKSIGRRIIPLQIKRVTEADQNKLEVAHLNYINFLDDERSGWEKLLTDLPPVLARDRRRLDPTFNKLHTDYLRTLFAHHDRVNLTYLLDAAPREAVSLFDVYVPLKLGVSFNLEVQDGEMVDWWLRDQDISSQPEEELEPHITKSLNGFEPQGIGLSAWVEQMKEAWAEYKANHEKEQSEKAEKDREPLKDGTYYWNRIESEVAPALHPHLVITGDPGSGKSTLLKHLALCMTGDMLHEGEESQADLNKLGFWPLPAYTPVFIELRALVSGTFPNPTDEVTLSKFFDYLNNHLLAPNGVSDYLEALRDQMRDGEVMLFLDGLDEVPQAGDTKRRKQIKSLANLLRKTYPQCRIVITSRPYAYAGDWKLDDFGQVNLTALDEDRLEELALRLFRVVLGQEGAEQEAPQFKDKMQEVPEELRRSPLFFTLMASIWLNNHMKSANERLPVTRGAIYRECVEMLIRRWTRKDLQTGQSIAASIGLTDDQLRKVLEQIAFQVHSEHGEQTDEAVFDGGMVYNLVRGLGIRGFDIDLLLDTLGQRAGVIFEKAPNHYQFAHRSFQEYLSASHLNKTDFPTQFVKCLTDNPDLWRNVGELLADEIQRTHGDLWKLLKALLPDRKAALPSDKSDTLWAKVVYATRLYFDHLRGQDEEQDDLYQKRLVPLLTRLIKLGAFAPVERAEAGCYLGRLGDPREGVGVKNGLPDLVWCEVPAGKFLFGSHREKDNLARDNEPDQYELNLPTFQIAKYPITYAQYEAFVQDKGYERRNYWTNTGWQWKGNKTYPEGYWNDPQWHIANHPVVGVTWYEAYAFCKWLSEKLGAEIRLPTEAEFEKAARGATDWIYPYGDDFDDNKENTSKTNLGRTSAVGIFSDGASPHGVMDMSGNVWEWSLSPWAALYQHQTAEQIDTEGDSARVLRGGSWNDNQDDTRVSYRGDNLPGSRSYNLGFRVVVSASLYRSL